MRISKNLKGGFTLVEIMIVVAIIGLLAAIAIPNFVRARETAQRNSCINNLRQIDGAIQQWALENKMTTGDAVVAADIDPYLKGTTAAIDCPASGNAGFAGSYTLNPVGTDPACQIDPVNHVLN